MPLYFSYGSNMDVPGMRQRCPEARPRGIARAIGWRFFIAACGYASLRPQPCATTHGVLWRVSACDVEALDLYEDTAGGLYRRTRIAVETPRGELSALIYLTTDTREGIAHPGYQEGIVAAAAEWRFPRSAQRGRKAWLPGERRGA